MATEISEIINHESFFAREEDMLTFNGYPGRWLAIGRGDEERIGELVMAYSFGGRSDGSKSRTAVLEDGAVRLYDPNKTNEEMAQVSDAALIYYHAMDSKDEVFVVSNGAQTRPVLDALVAGDSFEEAVSNAPTVPGFFNGKPVEIDLSSYEPDTPIFTPRITGMVDLRDGSDEQIGLAVVRKDLETGDPIRTFYTGNIEDLPVGEAVAIQTYAPNDPDDRETPVPHFTADPYGFELNFGTPEIAREIFHAIGERTCAATIVRSIDLETKRFNGHTILNTRG